MPDPEILIENLELARTGLNRVRNTLEQWRQGAVAGIKFTPSQIAALKADVNAGMQNGKDGMTDFYTELLN